MNLPDGKPILVSHSWCPGCDESGVAYASHYWCKAVLVWMYKAEAVAKAAKEWHEFHKHDPLINCDDICKAVAEYEEAKNG